MLYEKRTMVRVSCEKILGHQSTLWKKTYCMQFLSCDNYVQY